MHKVSGAVRSTHGQDGAIVLDVQQGHMFNLNIVGSRILELLEHGSAESEVVKVISREFNAAPELVESDVREFLEALKGYELIEDRRSDGAV
jgi:Coenzyme PQQ synthesis protein D (PqqD)